MIRIPVVTVIVTFAAKKKSLTTVRVCYHRLGRQKWLRKHSIKSALGMRFSVTLFRYFPPPKIYVHCSVHYTVPPQFDICWRCTRPRVLVKKGNPKNPKRVMVFGEGFICNMIQRTRCDCEKSGVKLLKEGRPQ